MLLKRLISLMLRMGYAEADLMAAHSLAAARPLLERMGSYGPGLALVDLGLPDGNGCDLISEMRDTFAQLPIMVVSAWSSQDSILAALRAGASGYVCKERDDFEVTLSIRGAVRGAVHIEPPIARHILDALEQVRPGSTAALSDVQRQVLDRVIDGLSHREIAAQLLLERSEVDRHIRDVCTKFHIGARAMPPRLQ